MVVGVWGGGGGGGGGGEWTHISPNFFQENNFNSRRLHFVGEDTHGPPYRNGSSTHLHVSMTQALLTVVPSSLSDPNSDLDLDSNNQNYASSASYCNYETVEDLNDLISFSLFH